MQLLPLGGTTRLPSLAALGWIIAYYVEIGKIRVDGLPRRCAPRNDWKADSLVIARRAKPDVAIRNPVQQPPLSKGGGTAKP